MHFCVNELHDMMQFDDSELLWKSLYSFIFDD